MAIKRDPITEDDNSGYTAFSFWHNSTDDAYNALVPGQHVNVVLLMLGAFVGGLGMGAVLAAVVAWIVMR